MKRVLCYLTCAVLVLCASGCVTNTKMGTPKETESTKVFVKKEDVLALLELDENTDGLDLIEYDSSNNVLEISTTDKLSGMCISQFAICGLAKLVSDEDYMETLKKATADWNERKQKWCDIAGAMQQILNEAYEGAVTIKLHIYTADKNKALTVHSGKVEYDYVAEHKDELIN